MKSAYLVLGVPGNATKEDIEAAFQVAKDLYSPARLAAEPHTLEKFLEVKTAYQVLRDEDSRAAHDRKLSGAQAGMAPRARPARPVMVEQEASWASRAMPILLAVAVVVAGTIFYVSSKREAARKELAAQELQLKAQVAAEEKKEELRLAAEEANRVRLARQTEQQERQFRQESDRAINNVRSAETQRSYQETQRANAEQRESQRKESEARSQEQRMAREAQQRVSTDKARIRELCYQNYRRYDC
ncbi:MAG: DnaJ domain-containing protein [Polaromonas sp.]|nr:DnaJ domain-containing protein [Polaromonas sp.]